MTDEKRATRSGVVSRACAGTPVVDGRYQEAMTLAKAKGVTIRPR